MGHIVPWTPNRELIYGMLSRAKRFHCSVGGTYEFDVEALLAARRAARKAGRRLSLTACLVRATSLVLERYPRLNQHLFHGLFRKYVYAFDGIHCTLIVQREGSGGERVLLPVLVRDANTLSLDALEEIIRHHKETPLAELPQAQALARFQRMPRLAMKWFSYKARSDHRFYERYFGAYGLSSLVMPRGSGRSAWSLSNVATSFFPGTLTDRPVAVRGKVEVRKVLSVLCVFDHYLVDGGDMIAAVEHLRALIEEPARLGL
jgi:pyruvate/2-oxoglutarate dehydrogenase complex dihydrolipoamide acyltransferase (E2) component